MQTLDWSLMGILHHFIGSNSCIFPYWIDVTILKKQRRVDENLIPRISVILEISVNQKQKWITRYKSVDGNLASLNPGPNDAEAYPDCSPCTHATPVFSFRCDVISSDSETISCIVFYHFFLFFWNPSKSIFFFFISNTAYLSSKSLHCENKV